MVGVSKSSSSSSLDGEPFITRCRPGKTEADGKKLGYYDNTHHFIIWAQNTKWQQSPERWWNLSNSFRFIVATTSETGISLIHYWITCFQNTITDILKPIFVSLSLRWHFLIACLTLDKNPKVYSFNLRIAQGWSPYMIIYIIDIFVFIPCLLFSRHIPEILSAIFSRS